MCEYFVLRNSTTEVDKNEICFADNLRDIMLQFAHQTDEFITK